MENFDNIKVGDKVIVHTRWHGDLIETVKKVAKTTFSTDSATFYKNTGWQRGGDTWTPKRAELATEERAAEVMKAQRKVRLANYLRGFDFYSLPIEKLEEIYNLTKK